MEQERRLGQQQLDGVTTLLPLCHTEGPPAGIPPRADFFWRPPRREQRDAGTPDKKHATPFAGKRKKGYLCGVWRCGAHGNL